MAASGSPGLRRHGQHGQEGLHDGLGGGEAPHLHLTWSSTCTSPASHLHLTCTCTSLASHLHLTCTCTSSAPAPLMLLTCTSPAPARHLHQLLACSCTSWHRRPGGKLHGGAEGVLHPGQLQAGRPRGLRDGGGVPRQLQVPLLPLHPALRRRREADDDQPAGRRRREVEDSGRKRRQALELDASEVRREYEAEVAGDILLPSEEELREVGGG